MGKRKVELTHAFINKRLSYDPLTGIFKWKINVANVKSGDVAGCPTPKGYLFIGIGGHILLAQRLAWFLMKKRWPAHEVDHKDRNRSNNIWTNLRKATGIQNNQNSSIRSDNTSGYKGVYFDKKKEKWMAYINVNKKRKFLGYYIQVEAAALAYNRSAKENFGKFAALNTVTSIPKRKLSPILTKRLWG